MTGKLHLLLKVMWYDESKMCLQRGTHYPRSITRLCNCGFVTVDFGKFKRQRDVTNRHLNSRKSCHVISLNKSMFVLTKKRLVWDRFVALEFPFASKWRPLYFFLFITNTDVLLDTLDVSKPSNVLWPGCEAVHVMFDCTLLPHESISDTDLYISNVPSLSDPDSDFPTIMESMESCRVQKWLHTCWEYCDTFCWSKIKLGQSCN